LPEAGAAAGIGLGGVLGAFIAPMIAGSALGIALINKQAGWSRTRDRRQYKNAGLTPEEIAALDYQRQPFYQHGPWLSVKNPAPAGYEADLASATAKTRRPLPPCSYLQRPPMKRTHDNGGCPKKPAPTTAVEAAARAMADAPTKIGKAVAGEVAKFKPSPVNIDPRREHDVSASSVVKSETKLKALRGFTAI